jgi:hypothetical protein
MNEERDIAAYFPDGHWARPADAGAGRIRSFARGRQERAVFRAVRDAFKVIEAR